MKVLTFSRFFPATHPRNGEETFFIEKIWQGLQRLPLSSIEIATPDPRLEEHLKNHYTKIYDPKLHTIRGGKRWKEGDWFSPRIWSGKPYANKQIQFSLPIQIKKIWNFKAVGEYFYLNEKPFDVTSSDLPVNDGLSTDDFLAWFDIHPKKKHLCFDGQLLCWDETLNY